MCGIKPTNMKHASARHAAGGYRRQPTARLGTVARRVPPFQGWDGLIGPGSQGVALGCRVDAPLARQRVRTHARRIDRERAGDAPLARQMVRTHWPISAFQPERLQPISLEQRPRHAVEGTRTGFSAPTAQPAISPGQRPGNPTTNKIVSPERATPGRGHAQARDLDQTIAGNVPEILEG